MANTTNFGWETPDDTDLVKDGAAAMRTLGNAIDASLVDLKGGTTGQVLSKNTNTDMDFVWTTPQTGDITAVTAGTGLSGGGTSGDVTLTNTVATTFDAKGDLVVGTGADTFAKLVAGSNGDTLVADSSATTGLRWQGNFAAGKNAIINGDMRIWQRGTTFNNVANGTYTADRWQAGKDGTATINVTQQTFTPGTAPVAGYESQYFLRFDVSSWTSSPVYLTQKIEDVRTFAGQTVTVSFWAKANSSTTNDVLYLQDFGSGGSGAVTSSTQVTIGTSWARYSVTFAIPSISGKTVGTSSSLIFQILRFSAARTVEVWGVQVEAGSVATAFQTATGTLAGELSACQRYYWRAGGDNLYQYFALGVANTTTNIRFVIQNPVGMRTAPTSVDYSNVLLGGGGTDISNPTLTLDQGSRYAQAVNAAVTGQTQFRTWYMLANNSLNTYIGFSAEL